MSSKLCCSFCAEECPRSSFTRGQLKKDENRQCSKCMAMLGRLRQLSEIEFPISKAVGGKVAANKVTPGVEAVGFISDMLCAYSHHREVLVDSLVALAHHCLDWVGCREACWEKHALQTASSALVRYVDDTPVVARALLLVGNLCDSPDRACAALEDGVLRHAVSALSTHLEDEPVQRFAASCVANLCFHSHEAKLVAVKGGAPRCLLSTLDAWYADSDAVTANVLHALAILADVANDHGGESFAIAPALIMAAMAAHPESVAVQRNGLEAIANLCDGAPKLRDAALAAGCLEVVVTALQRWGKQDENIAEAGVCGALDALTQGECEEAHEAAIQAAEEVAKTFGDNGVLGRDAKRLRDIADGAIVGSLKRLRIGSSQDSADSLAAQSRNDDALRIDLCEDSCRSTPS